MLWANGLTTIQIKIDARHNEMEEQNKLYELLQKMSGYDTI